LMQRHANIWKPLITATLIELGLHEKVRGPKQAGFEKVLNTHNPRDGAEDSETEAAE
ncbi:MAG: hypothetical protein RL492_1761, partial [Verrucomicrobiota bacterium]